MNDVWLLDFLALARCGSFSKASKLRNTTQSTLSKRIKAFEQRIDAELFDRSSFPIRLSEAGRAIETIAQDITDQIQAMRNLAREAAGRIQSAVAIATTHAVALSFFPNWLQRVERGLGRFPIRLDCYGAEGCFRALQDGGVELVICSVPARPIEPHGSMLFESIQLASDEALPVSAPDASGRPAHALPGARNKPTAYLSLASGSWMGSAVRVLLAEHRSAAVLQTVFETPLIEAVKTMAIHGYGLAWLPRSMIAGELMDGRLVVAGDAGWSIAMEMRVFRAARRLTPQAEALWEHLTSSDAA